MDVKNVAIPVFRSRVAPVFDSCTKALLVGIEHRCEIERSDLILKNFSSTERVAIVRRLGVTDLICGGISKSLHAVLENSGIHVIPGIAGPVEDILAAFMNDRLNQPQFRMPGHGCLERNI
jgi:predicted Fe-Mo cluster-binding NifX family protein